MSASRRKRSQRRERRRIARAALRPKLGEQLLQVWEHARWVFVNFVEFFATPVAIANRDYINRTEYRAMDSWLRSLELLTRRLILAAALAIEVVLKPLDRRAPARQSLRSSEPDPQPRPRQRRRVLVWLDKPATWIARLRIFPRKPPEERFIDHNKREQPRVLPSFPLARRLEAVRRVLADPDRRAHRLAVKLARIAARNAKANAPRLFGVRAWDPHRILNRGQRFIRTGMEIVMPLIEDALAAWNERFEPG
jgi:hypothetical protein